MNDPNQSLPRDPVFNFPSNLFLPEHHTSYHRKVAGMSQNLRRSSRHRTASESAGPSGSEYHGSDKSMDAPHDDGDQHEVEPEPTVEYSTSSRGRKIVKKTYIESNSEDDGMLANNLFDDEEVVEPHPKRQPRRSHSHDADGDDDDEDEEVGPSRYSLRGRTSRTTRANSFITSEDEDNKAGITNGRYPTRSRTKKPTPPQSGPAAPPAPPGPSQRSRRLAKRNAVRGHDHEEDLYVDNASSGASADADGSIEDAQISSDIEPEPEPDPEPEEVDGRPYALRVRQRINYAIPPPLEEMRKPANKPGGGGRNGGRSNGYHGGGGAHRPKGRALPWSANGAELGRWMGMGGEDSDSDHPTRTPRKQYGAGGAGFGTMAGGNGLLGPDLAAGGTPSNFGKISEKASEIFSLYHLFPFLTFA